jgi:hypothetical protein
MSTELVIKKLTRAINGVPKGGMQTGNPKVTLPLADAQYTLNVVQHLHNDLRFMLEQSCIIEHMQDHTKMRELRKKYGVSEYL